MITIPPQIKYDNDIHSLDLVTKWLNPENNLKFIIKVLEQLKKDGAESYLVKRDMKVAVCRKGLTPAITGHTERYVFFALKNRYGRIIATGKNLRRPESLIPVLKNLTKNNPAKQQILNKTDLTVADRCYLVNYELLKQSIPFK